jgi:iron complex outermembrane recepter protein
MPSRRSCSLSWCYVGLLLLGCGGLLHLPVARAQPLDGGAAWGGRADASLAVGDAGAATDGGDGAVATADDGAVATADDGAVATADDGAVAIAAYGAVATAAYGAVATATRAARPLGRSPASATVLRRDEIDRNPSQTTDALLRSLPSVQTFRRSTSLVADPSAQGLNLRGVGPSGVSRTLVLMDGVPMNEPFGGSLYWRALPRLGLERIEVVPGGGSALYGSAALSGVVQLFSRRLLTEAGDPCGKTRRLSVDADASYGALHTYQLAARSAYGARRLGASLEGEWLRSSGYRVVASDQAGPIDGDADSAHGTLNARLEARPVDALHLASSLRLFRERQNGGTRFTTADARFALLDVSASWRLPAGAALSLALFGRLQRFEQDRARIAPMRVSEALAARQDVPAQDQGASLVYSAPRLQLAGEHALALGLDARRSAGTSRERVYAAAPDPSALRRRDAGGQQLSLGAFVQDTYAVAPWLTLDAALRGDLFHNWAGEVVLQRESGASEATTFAPQTKLALSPRVGALVSPFDWLHVRGSLYRAFRAPTLNELYRPFQVGTVLTAANAALGPELLHGFEAGFDLAPQGTLIVRAVGFYNRLDRPISNVTLATPAADGAQRQRQNLGRARVRGIETSIEWRPVARVTTVAAYTLSVSEVIDAGAQDTLLGKRLPQAPLHRASALLSLVEPRWLTATVQLRVLGAQYEDDLNTLRMRAYALVDLSLSRAIGWNVELFAAVENLLDARYVVGRAGVDTVGQPLTVRGGVRVRAPCL